MFRQYFFLLLLSPALGFADTVKNADAATPINQLDAPTVAKSYDGGMRGLKSLMKDLKRDDLRVYDSLRDDYSDLKFNHYTGLAITWAGILASGVMVLDVYEKFDNDDLEDNDYAKDFFVGAGIYYIASFIGGYIQPNSQDFKDFTNRHNDLNPKSQITWDSASLRVYDANKPVMLTLNFKF